MFQYSDGVVSFLANVTTGILLPASDYINFGATAGTSGYGFRDNSGTVEFKNSGGAWTAFGGTSAPVDATYITQTPNGTLTNEQAMSALATGLVYSTTTTGVQATVANAAAGQVLVSGTPPAYSATPSVTSITLGTSGILIGGTNLIEQRNGASAQKTSVYNTYTSATNFEVFNIDWQRNAGSVTLESIAGSAGGGVRVIRFYGSQIILGHISTPDTEVSDWQIDGNGMFGGTSDNVRDLGVNNAQNRPRTLYLGTSLDLAGSKLVAGSSGTLTKYNNITTAGFGVPAIVAAGRVTAQSAANASISTYTVGAADGSFEISANMNVTASATLVTTLTCTYTDESNTARTMVLPIAQLAGSFIAAGAITGTGAWESPVMHIRCKAATAITILTSTGTFTTVTYTAEGIIKQVA
jgi:hypothetical protein